MSTPQLDASVWVARDDSAERGDTRRGAHRARLRRPRRAGRIAGFACDAGVARNQGRVGAAAGRPASAVRPACRPMTRLLDAGDVACEGDALEAAQDALGQRVAALGARPLVLGGGHEIAWGSFQGLARWLESRGDDGAVLVLNRTRTSTCAPAGPAARARRSTRSPATAGNAAASCSTPAWACRGWPIRRRCSRAPTKWARSGSRTATWANAICRRGWNSWTTCWRRPAMYLTIDRTCCPRRSCPACRRPPYGVPMAVVEEIALRVKASGKLRLADMAEYNPRFDVDGHGARAARGWRQLLSA